jgi:hypothetical protein
VEQTFAIVLYGHPNLILINTNIFSNHQSDLFGAKVGLLEIAVESFDPESMVGQLGNCRRSMNDSATSG